MNADNFIIKEITPKTAYDVRHPVLRAGKPIDSCHFDGDNLPSTFHLGYYEMEQLAGVVTLLERKHAEIISEKAFQLRGMAVLASHQKKGIGQALVLKAEAMIQQRDGTLIWMNAREIAVPFYEKLGYAKFGVPFSIPNIGLHFIMIKKL